MSNEELVMRINAGENTADNLQDLYMKNLPFIKKIVKPFLFKESEEDLLQECFFGLVEAVKHYETSENVKFLTYASFWLKQSCIRYIENYGNTIRIPSHFSNDIYRYKSVFSELSNKLGRLPNDKEVAETLKIDLRKLQRIKKYSKDIKSLNEKYITEDGVEHEVIDAIKADFSLEETVVNNLYDEQCKIELWGLLDRCATPKENEIIKQRYKEVKTYKEIAENENITIERVRQIEKDTLRKLRRGIARKDLSNKFEFVTTNAYHTGVQKFKNTWESATEKTAINLLDFERYRKKRLQELELKNQML